MGQRILGFLGLILMGSGPFVGCSAESQSYAARPLVLGDSLWAGDSSSEAEPVLGLFRNTYYYVTFEKPVPPTERTAELLDMQGQVLARVSPTYKRKITIEGTGRLLDGRVLNFAGRVKGEVRFKVVDEEYGLGVGNCPLEPFVSLAVDPKVIPLGTLVRIDETIGLKLPDGQIHNGLWRAEDVGSAIKGDRVDLFIGNDQNVGFLEKNGISYLRPLTVRWVADPEEGNCATQHARYIRTLREL